MQQRESAFYAGLTGATIIEIERKEYGTEAIICTKFKALEETLLQFPTITIKPGQMLAKPHIKTELETAAVKSKLWCRFHQSPYHSDAEYQRELSGRKRNNK